MFGLGKRKRELETAAKIATRTLLDEAILEDRRRRGDTNDAPPSSEERSVTLAAWAASARRTWQEAKRGNSDALRQTARNYLFGTGMPVKPRKACMWLAAATLLEMGPNMELPSVDPFWEYMEDALNTMLTEKEIKKAVKDGGDWVTELRRR